MITQRILSLLEEKSLTATDLCRAIGINTSTMTNWKNRGTDPPAKMIIPICEFLGVSSDYLLTGKERSSKQDVLSEDSEWLALIHQLPHEYVRLQLPAETDHFGKQAVSDRHETAAIL